MFKWWLLTMTGVCVGILYAVYLAMGGTQAEAELLITTRLHEWYMNALALLGLL